MNYEIKEGDIIFRCAQYTGRFSFSISSGAIGKSGVSDEDLRILYLRSPYYKAAVDRFGVSLAKHGQTKSLGYLFPVSLLDKANEQEYSSMKEWQQDMMYMGYKKLIDYCDAHNLLYVKGNVVETLDELSFGEDVFLFVFDRSIEQNETKLIPALYEKGFYVVSEPVRRDKLYSSSYMKRVILSEQHHKDITLKEVTESFNEFGYLKDLFVDLLPYIENSSFRFFLLYQVVEYLIDLKKNETWFNNMNLFSAKHSNELIHSLLEVGKEERLINMVFHGFHRGGSVFQEFIDYAKKLYAGVNKDWTEGTDFPTCMYGVRNILVHNLKEAIDYSDVIDEIAERYEKIICEVILNVEIDDCHGKGIFVYDLNQKYKDNVRAFSKLFHDK